MQIVACEKMGDIPLWLLDHPNERDFAMRLLQHESAIIVARRPDGAVMVVPEGYHDTEEMEAMLRWAAA